MKQRDPEEAAREAAFLRPLKKFKKEPRYQHNRSEGMTRRTNAGTKFQVSRLIAPSL